MLISNKTPGLLSGIMNCVAIKAGVEDTHGQALGASVTMLI